MQFGDSNTIRLAAAICRELIRITTLHTQFCHFLFNQSSPAHSTSCAAMDEEGIGIVLAKATELRSKINNCLDKASSSSESPKINGSATSSSLVVNGGGGGTVVKGTVIEDPDPDDKEVKEAESLLNIRDALESLESQLASLQELQQQQRYEREAALADIDYSRQMLLKKLKEYKGKDLEVIHEASAFASESVEHGNDLLLPPYPSRPPRPLVLENGYATHFTLDKSFRNGVLYSDLTGETKKRTNTNHSQPGSRIPWRGLKIIFGSVAKMAITVVGVVSILSMAGFEPRLRRRNTNSKFLSFFALPAPENLESRSISQCPPGKVLVMEDGETRCIVKERIEIPFESVIVTPDVSYGCG